MITTLSAEIFEKKLNEKSVFLLDVREPAEHKAQNIPGAFLIPLAQLSYAALPVKDVPLAIYCKAGGRSLEACKRLQAEQPSIEVYSLEGGILAWARAGFTVSQEL